MPRYIFFMTTFMIKVIIQIVIAVFCVESSHAESQQRINVRIVSGGGVSVSGKVKSIQLGAPMTSRNGGKVQQVVRTQERALKATPATTKVSATDINAEFRLREVYVFPNPAKGGKAPTFHVEVGIADSVKITVYTVAGEEVHKCAIGGVPNAINDGNGVDYAYEYVWRGHIPSGVYYYLIEAEKVGKKLRKTGKFAVIR